MEKPWKNHPQMIFELWFPGVSRKKSSVMADSYRVSYGDLPVDGTYEEISIETNLDVFGNNVIGTAMEIQWLMDI
jgi:hypothetical protein